jgi:hypothetical protein
VLLEPQLVALQVSLLEGLQLERLQREPRLLPQGRHLELTVPRFLKRPLELPPLRF